MRINLLSIPTALVSRKRARQRNIGNDYEQEREARKKGEVMSDLKDEDQKALSTGAMINEKKTTNRLMGFCIYHD